jgi:hypothetical protein
VRISTAPRDVSTLARLFAEPGYPHVAGDLDVPVQPQPPITQAETGSVNGFSGVLWDGHQARAPPLRQPALGSA